MTVQDRQKRMVIGGIVIAAVVVLLVFALSGGREGGDNTSSAPSFAQSEHLRSEEGDVYKVTCTQGDTVVSGVVMLDSGSDPAEVKRIKIVEAKTGARIATFNADDADCEFSR